MNLLFKKQPSFVLLGFFIKYFYTVLAFSLFMPFNSNAVLLPPLPVAIYTDNAYITVKPEGNSRSILVTTLSPKLLITLVEYIPQSCVSNCNPTMARMICISEHLNLMWIKSFDQASSGALTWDGVSQTNFFYAENKPSGSSVIVRKLSIVDGAELSSWTVINLNNANCIKIANSDLFGCGRYQGTNNRLGYFVVSAGTASGTSIVASQWGSYYSECVFCDSLAPNKILVISRIVTPSTPPDPEVITGRLAFLAATQGNPWIQASLQELNFIWPSGIDSILRFSPHPMSKTSIFLMYPTNNLATGNWVLCAVNLNTGSTGSKILYEAVVVPIYVGASLIYLAVLGVDQKTNIYYNSPSNFAQLASMTNNDLLGSLGGRPFAIHEITNGQILVLFYGSSLTIERIEQRGARNCPTNTLDFLGRGCKAILTSGCFNGCSSCLTQNDPNTCITTSDSNNLFVFGFGLRCKNGIKYFKPGETTCSPIVTVNCPNNFCAQECMSSTTCAAYCNPLIGPQFCREPHYFFHWASEAEYKASTIYASCQGVPDNISLKACRDAYRIICCWGNEKLSYVYCGSALARIESEEYCRFCPYGLSVSECSLIDSSCFRPTLAEPMDSDYSMVTTQECIASLLTNTNIVAAYSDPIMKKYYDIFNCYDPALVSSEYSGKDYFILVFNKKLLPNLAFSNNSCSPYVIGADEYWSKGSPVCSQPNEYSIQVTTTSYTYYFPSKVTISAQTSCKAPFTITATLTNVPASLIVTANLINPIINRCKNVEINSLVLPEEKSLVVAYAWTATYANSNTVPNSIVSALQSYANTTYSKLLLPGYTLARGATIQVSLTVSDSTTGKSASTSISFITDSAGTNVYCGPCQLDNRALCSQFNGICWKDFNNGSESPNYSDTCLWQMASICYDLWKNNPSDPQCSNFNLNLSYSLMSKIPAALNGNHTTGDGSIITINFDMNISNSQLTNCAMVLTAASLRAISPDYSCTWINKTQYQIKYVPSGNNFIKNITLKSRVIAFDYLYSQEYMQETNLQVIPPILITKATLVAPATASACATLTLSLLPVPDQSNFWQFAWKIIYSSGNYTANEKQIAEKYFAQYEAWTETNRIISIPSTYLYSNSILNVVANAKNSFSTGIIANEANINLSSSLPSVTFKSKQSLLEILTGNKKNSIPVEVSKKNCGQIRRILQESGNNNSSNLKDVIIWFEVYSGTNDSNINIRGDEEKQIEKKLNERFTNLQLVSLSIFDYFKYYIYYNLTAFAKYQDSNDIASDYLIIMLTKKPLTCKIDTSGFLLKPKSDITLDSTQSELDWGDGDSVSYYWSCEECKYLANSAPCSCNIFKSNSEQRSKNAIISANTLTNFAKYTLSLSITITTGSYTRSCYASTYIVTHEKARSGVKAANKNGYEKQSSSGESYIYFVSEMANSDLEDQVIDQEWVLIEISSKDDEKIQYSNIYSYLSDSFKNDYNVKVDPNLLSNDKTIPSDIIPKKVTFANAFPPILGVSKKDLMPNTKYNYALKIRYYNSPAVITSVIFESKPAVAPRTLKISPDNGIAYITKFAFTFYANLGHSSDQASYQLYRLDCPNQSPQGEYRIISPKIYNANSFTSTLSPGLTKCSYQISIKLITTEDSSQAESMQTITVEPQQGESQESLIESMLNDLLSPNVIIPYTQSISMLIMISQAGIAGTMTDKMVTGTMQLLSKYTAETLTELLASLDSESQIDFVNVGAGAIQSVIVTAQDKIDKNVANSSMVIISSYLMNVKTADGGSFVIPTILGALAGLVGVPDKTFKNQEFYTKMMYAMNMLTDMKLKEIIPGGPPFSLSSPDIEMVIQSQMIKKYNLSQTCKTELNQTVILPPNLAPIFVNQSNGSISINKISISMALFATTFNPYTLIKNNTVIDNNSLTNNSIEGGRVYPETMVKIYNDLKNTDKLNSLVDKTTTDSKVLQSSFFMAKYSAISGQEVFNQNISVGLLPNGSEVESYLDLSYSSAKANNATKIPVYYIAENNTWTNAGCYLNSSNSSMSYNSTQAGIKCNTVGSPKQNITARIAMIMAIDLIKDVWSVIKAGNYQMLFNFNSLTDLNAENSIGLIIGFGIVLFVIIGSYLLYKMDEKALFLARYEALYKYFDKSELVNIQEKGLLADLKKFFSEVKKKGFIGKAESDKKEINGGTLNTEVKIKKRPSKRHGNTKFRKQRNNGYHYLSKKDEKELKNLYGTLKYEANPVYGEQKSLEILRTDIMESKILTRKTEVYLENLKEDRQDTFWGLLITEHPWLLIIFVLNMSTPRYIQLIITGMIFLGQLFTSGYFYDATDKIDVSDNVSEFIGKAVVVTIASALLMIPIKITASVFLNGKAPTENMTREQVDQIERRNPFFQKIGLCLAFIWIIICAWGITMFSIQFESVAMHKWIYTYLICFGNEFLIVEQLKIGFRILIGILLMRFAKSRLMLTLAGAVAAKFVDFIMKWV